MPIKKTLSEKILGAEQARKFEASYKMKILSRYMKALDESNKEFLKTGKNKFSQELIDASNEYKLLEMMEKRKKRVAVNTKNASKPRKEKPSKSVLLEYKSKYAFDHGSSRGWKKSAQLDFSIDTRTLNKILE